jgi:processive 1,2-diacylglycerol beta-glucosyltransferase
MHSRIHPARTDHYQTSYKKKNEDLFFLILSCSGGAGHLRAAEALHCTAPQTGLPIRTESYDVLDFTTKLFKRLYSESYLQLVNRAPELWGYFYQASEKKPYKKKGIIKLFDRFNYKRYLERLGELDPDAVICTHFLPYISISKELRKITNAPVFAVTTDFDIHQLWVDPIVNRYFVYHNESAWQLQSKNIDPSKIVTAGIPVMPQFQLRTKKSVARKKLGMEAGNFTVLVLSGGFGVGKIKETTEQISRTLSSFPKKRFNLAVVCGKNEKTRKELAGGNFPRNVRPMIFGFVDNIHELMDSADVLVSKAGGLTSSEAMAKSLPMLIIDPIPGQESRNTDLIVEHGAGWKAINLSNLSYKLKRIIESPSILSSAASAAEKLSKPEAAGMILKNIYEYVSRRS